jgi:glucose-1-phosphate thymidylyltransferase
MKGVLLAGGTGSRLRPITHTGPKQLIPIANKPVLEYAIEDFKDAGITEIGVILGNKGREEIQELLGDGSDYGVELTYIVQGNPLGLAHAVGSAADFVGDDDFVVYLGDNILKSGIDDLVESFEANDYGAGIALQEVENPQQFGVAALDEDHNVTRLVEKPDDPPSNFALIGIYVFSSEVFDIIEELEPSWRGELEITDAIQGLLDRNRPVDSHVVEGWWKDTGKPKDILEANRLVLENGEFSNDGTIERGTDVTGKVDMQEGAVIESGAVVRGPVSIGRGVTIESDTYIGPYTSIGESSTISNARIENTVIVGESEIHTSGKIVDSLIGRQTTIGSAEDMLPEGQRLIVGENSSLQL